MRALLVVTAVLIIYGSIYPLNFSSYTYTPERMAQLVDFTLDKGLNGNTIANILLFVPYGFFTVLAVSGSRNARAWQIALICTAGLLIAYGVQFAQVFIAGRVPSGVDVVWNVLGMLAGLAAGFAFAGSRHRLMALTGPLPVPLLLVGGWLVYQWLPLVPTLDLGLLAENAVTFLSRRVPSPFWVFQNTVVWLVCYQLLERYAPRIRLLWYPLATLLVLVAGAVLVGSTVNVDDFIGAACGLILWRALGGRWSPATLALLLALAIVGASYLSLTPRETPASFSWIPFSGSLGSNVMLNVMATWKKLVLYGLLIWLLLEARLHLLPATVVTALVLFVSEWFQVYVQGATPEITDALVAVGIGVAIALRGERPRGQQATKSAVQPADEADSGNGGADTEDVESGHDNAERSRSGAARRATPRRGYLRPLGVGIVLAGAVGLLTRLPEGPAAVIRGDIPWAGQRADLIADLHTHTRTSDGSLAAPDLVAASVAAGCDILAITDHSDVGASGGDAQRRAIATLRRQHPELILFLGLELNIPAYAGREHMNILLHPDQEAWLPELRRAAEARARGERGSPQDPDRRLLRLVNRIRDGGHPAFLIYNHPSRKVKDVGESLQDLLRWRLLGTRVDAMAGAPGHQRYADIGSYSGPVTTDGRWDPATATVGGVWDQYLATGGDLWAALASSDFHGSPRDETPCAFSRIHVAAPERSHAGVLEALDMGTFWSDHGRILDHLLLEVEFDGVSRSLYPGESVDVFTEDSFALARVILERGPGSARAPLHVEFISSCVDGISQVVSSQVLSPEQNSAESLIPLQATSEQDNSCTVRARVRLNQYGLEPDLFAYTNYLRVNLRLGVLDGHVLDWRLQ